MCRRADVVTRLTMSKIYSDVMVVSLTVNVCALTYNVIPRLRRKVCQSPNMQGLKTLQTICRHYENRPFLLAKIITDHSLLWLLVLFSFIAIGVTDVINYPFNDVTASAWQKLFLEALLGVNVGRYIFMIVQMLFVSFTRSKVKYRSTLIHHTVTLVCYSLLLAYRQNVLLALVGTIIESTSIFEEFGHYYRDSDKRHTRNYRRLVVISCIYSILFRGLIPLTFLVIAIFKQTPFAMDNIPLTVFFLSSIFFAVINMWDICLNIQRLMKNTHESEQDLVRDTCVGSRISRGKPLQMSKNNLGYLRPYDNKNIANHYEDEKHNLNNHKEFPKETLELHIQPSMLVNSQQDVAASKSSLGVEYDLNSEYQPSSLEDRTRINLRVSNSSNESTDVDTVLIAATNTSRLNNSISEQTFSERTQEVTFDIRSQSLELIHGNLCACYDHRNGIPV